MNCVKCGRPMKDKEKWCYSCGALNPTVGDNVLFLKKNKINPEIMIDSNALSYDITSIVLINIGFYLFYAFLFFFSFKFSKIDLPMNIFLLTFLTTSSYFIACFVNEFIFLKAHITWWLALVPLVNIFTFIELAFGYLKPLGWYLFISVSALLLGVMLNYADIGMSHLITTILKYAYLTYTVFFIWYMYFSLGKKFGKSGILTMLFPYVMLFIIAFDKKVTYHM